MILDEAGLSMGAAALTGSPPTRRPPSWVPPPPPGGTGHACRADEDHDEV